MGCISFCRMVTPPPSPVRFNARFLVVDFDLISGTLVGSGELEGLRYVGVEEALGLKVALPTRQVLNHLRPYLAMSHSRAGGAREHAGIYAAPMGYRMMPASYATHRAQIGAILASWGMAPADAERTAEVMAWADLHGIDSHGVSMLTVYHERWKAGRLNIGAAPRVVKETPVSVAIDGDGGLGHLPSRLAMDHAIAKARTIGIGVATVRNSAHFGATGILCRDGRRGGVYRPGHDQRLRPAGGANRRQRSQARHRPDCLRRPGA